MASTRNEVILTFTLRAKIDGNAQIQFNSPSPSSALSLSRHHRHRRQRVFLRMDAIVSWPSLSSTVPL